MDVQDIYDACDDYGFEDTSTTRKMEKLMAALHDINSRARWPFLEASDSLTLSSGDDTPTMPSNFGKVAGLFIPSEGINLVPRRRSYITSRFSSSLTDTGTPYYYYFIGTTLHVFRIPDADYTATLDYTKMQPTLTDASVEADILLPARHHEVLVYGTLTRLYAMEDDPELGTYFKNEYEQKIAQMVGDLVITQIDRPNVMEDVWDDDGWC